MVIGRRALSACDPSLKPAFMIEVNKKKRLEAFLSYHQHMVEDKGLPPSRLMLQHTAVSGDRPVDPEKAI